MLHFCMLHFAAGRQIASIGTERAIFVAFARARIRLRFCVRPCDGHQGRRRGAGRRGLANERTLAGARRGPFLRADVLGWCAALAWVLGVHRILTGLLPAQIGQRTSPRPLTPRLMGGEGGDVEANACESHLPSPPRRGAGVRFSAQVATWVILSIRRHRAGRKRVVD